MVLNQVEMKGKKKTQSKTSTNVDNTSFQIEKEMEDDELGSENEIEPNQNQIEDEKNEDDLDVPKESKSKMKQRHLKETKDLVKKIQTTMHAIPKTDKKLKKETLEITKKMEEELKNKHDLELKKIEYSSIDLVSKNQEVQIQSSSLPQNSKPSKSQKQKEKKLVAAMDRDRRIAEEKKNLVNYREIENNSLKDKLIPLQLCIKDIAPDGNCMYAAIADQLELNEFGKKLPKNHCKVLRTMAATFMRDHPDDFIPFIDSVDGDIISQDQFLNYCNTIENTNAWGGQLELKALSHSLQVPIFIFTGDPKSPNVEMGQEYNKHNKPVRLSFHQHAYTLGDHYNSVVPNTQNESLFDDNVNNNNNSNNELQ